MATQQYIEAAVAKVGELKDGEMREVTLAEGKKALLVNDHGKLLACGHKCTHYGASLKNGSYSNGRVRCPLHGACFNVGTGDIEDFPGMDSIHTFEVRIEDQDVIVRAPARALESDGWKRTPKMVSASPSDDRIFVIVGGGAAGATCAETLRQEGFQGKILMICKENYLPYDRPKLSKTMTVDPLQIALRTADFYKTHNIDVVLGKAVAEFNADTHSLTLEDGTSLNFHAAFVAPGGTPRTLPVPGMDLKNIYCLRDPQDANFINSNVEGKNVVIVGSSFIGMEVASSIVKKAKSVIVIGMENVPFERVLGERIGLSLQRLHEKNGVVFRLKKIVKEFRGVDGQVRSVLLDSGELLDADICILGAGIVPSTKFVKGVKFERDGSIVCDQYLKAAEGVWAGGDICRFPFFLNNELIRIEHWGMAQYHGKLAAKNMVGKQVPAQSIPFFWTVLYGKSIRYCGHALSYDEILFDGNVEELSFLGLYCKHGEVVAAVSLGRDPIVSAIAELMHHKKMPKSTELKNGMPDFVQLAATL